MRRWVLLLSVLVLTALPVSAKMYVFPTTDDNMTIDGILAEWENATVLYWRSPLSNVEYDFLYLLHSTDYLYIGAKFYDYDFFADDELSIYLNTADSTYKIFLTEGDVLFEVYKYVNGSWVLVATNTTAVYTTSKFWDPYTYIELKIPKSEINLSDTFLLHLEHLSTFIRDVYSWYPPSSDFNNLSTWAALTLVTYGNRTLNLTLLDRDGEPVDYASDDLIVKVAYAANNTTVASMLGKSNFSVVLPPDVFNVTVWYLGVPVYSDTFDLRYENVSEVVYINNLAKVNTTYGSLVISVEVNGSLSSVDFDCKKKRAIVTTRSPEIFFDTKNPWLFLGVLYADSYEYNPYTGHLLVELKNVTKDTGLVLVMGSGDDFPVLYYANNTVKWLSYDYNTNVYSFYVEPGHYRFNAKGTPFAVAFNDTALRRGKDYTTNELNITSVNVTKEGVLKVYYDNPTTVTLDKTERGLKILVATPYVFNGKVHYVVKLNDRILNEGDITFKATPPLTSVTINPPTAGNVEIEVYDLDSDQLLFKTVKEFYINYTYLALTLAAVCGVLVAVIVAARRKKSEARVKIEEEYRFFRRL